MRGIRLLVRRDENDVKILADVVRWYYDVDLFCVAIGPFGANCARSGQRRCGPLDSPSAHLSPARRLRMARRSHDPFRVRVELVLVAGVVGAWVFAFGCAFPDYRVVPVETNLIDSGVDDGAGDGGVDSATDAGGSDGCPPAADATPADTTDTADTAEAAASDGTSDATSSCIACVMEKCNAEYNACTMDKACVDYFSCTGSCGSDGSCVARCACLHPSTKISPLVSCASTSCKVPCGL